MPRLRMNEAIPLLTLYAFMAWTGTPLPLPSPVPAVKHFSYAPTDSFQILSILHSTVKADRTYLTPSRPALMGEIK
jgi:hypothetical protein